MNEFHDIRPSEAGTAVAQWLRCCATNRKECFIHIKSLRSHYGPGVDSASNRNEYQEHFLGVKSGRCVRMTTLPPSCAFVMKSGNLNFLEPSGHLRACNGTVSPLPLHQTEAQFVWVAVHMKMTTEHDDITSFLFLKS